ncbi:MAG: FAD-dependent oxidoreductase [Halobacteria archaeon]|nr:FAD-dependent oxidoreductase [Halobacteria archaeon]
MADVIVIGDGPTGLSATLFLAKNDMKVSVFGEDETHLHKAYLYNYLGIKEIHGSDFVEIAREQVESFGANLHEEKVVDVESTDDGFVVTTESDDTYTSDYLVIATGFDRDLAEGLGVEFNDDGAIKVDRNCRTTAENVYAGGWSTRPDKIQAAISVGDGATIGLDILSDVEGEPVHDFDTPPG